MPESMDGTFWYALALSVPMSILANFLTTRAEAYRNGRSITRQTERRRHVDGFNDYVDQLTNNPIFYIIALLGIVIRIFYVLIITGFFSLLTYFCSTFGTSSPITDALSTFMIFVLLSFGLLTIARFINYAFILSKAVSGEIGFEAFPELFIKVKSANVRRAQGV